MGVVMAVYSGCSDGSIGLGVVIAVWCRCSGGSIE